MRTRNGPLVPFLVRRIYGLQGLLMWIVSLPVQIAMYEPSVLGIVGVLGIAFWTLGFGFEAIGDAQLTRFRADPDNQGRVLDSGLWAWTRHPQLLRRCRRLDGAVSARLRALGRRAEHRLPVLMAYLLVRFSGAAPGDQACTESSRTSESRTGVAAITVLRPAALAA